MPPSAPPLSRVISRPSPPASSYNQSWPSRTMRSCLPSGDQRACSLRAFRVNWRGAPPVTGRSQMSLSSLLVSKFFCLTVAEAHLPSGETWTSSTRRVASTSSGVKGRAASSRASNRLCMGCALYHEGKTACDALWLGPTAAPACRQVGRPLLPARRRVLLEQLHQPAAKASGAPCAFFSTSDRPLAWRSRGRRISGERVGDLSKVHVMQRYVGDPGGPARRVRLRDHSADVEPVGELHTELEGSQTKVDAEDVVRRPVRPRIREGGVELGVAMPCVVLHRPGRVHHAAEVEPDHAGEPAEERDPDQNVERELELRLADVVAVAAEPRVPRSEAAQVVEAGEEEPPAEPAALR